MIVSALLVFAALWPGGQPAYAAEYPSGDAVDTSWYDDAGTVFVLSTPEQLAGLAYLVSVEHVTFAGKTVGLANDIDLSGICSGGVSWRPIGTAYTGGESFCGVFDGQGYRISGLLIDDSGYYNALFGSVRGAAIGNLTVSGEVYGSEYVGGIISMCSDSDLVNLTNECYVDAVKYNEGTAHEGSAAGVVCYAATSYPTGDHYFENLVNKGDVVSSRFYTAGVIGFLYNSSGYTTRVVQCANYGNVDVTAARYGLDDANKSVGGVLGSTAGAYGTYVVSDCVNEGNVSTANCISAGGVAGYLGGNDSMLVLSENTGEINGANNAGGIVGYFGSSGGMVASNLNLGAVRGSQKGGVVGAASRNGQTLQNNFTLDSAASKAYGSRAGGVNEGTARSTDELKKQSFLDLLNDGTTSFSIVSSDHGGLPILTWTNPSAIPGQGGLPDDAEDQPDPDDKDEGDTSQDDSHSGEGDQTDHGSQGESGSGVDGEDESQYQNPGETQQGGLSPADAGAPDPTAPIVGPTQPADQQQPTDPDDQPKPDGTDPEQNEQQDQAATEQTETTDEQQAADEAEAAEDEAGGRQMVEVVAVPEDYLMAEDLGQGTPLVVRASLIAMALVCLGAGLVRENVTFSRSSRRSGRAAKPYWAKAAAQARADGKEKTA